MKSLLLALILLLVSSFSAKATQRYGEGFVEDFGNDLGDTLSGAAGNLYKSVTGSRCTDENAAEFDAFNCGQGYHYVGLQSPVDVSQMQNLQEELMFLEAARRTYQFSVCQKGLHDRYVEDPAAREDMHRNAFEQFSQVRNHVRRSNNRALASDAAADNVRDNFFAAEDRYNPAYYEAQRRRAESEAAAAGERQNIEALLSRVPMGNRKEMKDLLVELATRNGEISREEFDRVYATGMQTLRVQTRQSMEFFRPLRSVQNGKDYIRVSESFKKDLINSGQIENVIDSLGIAEPHRTNFMCRIDTRYSTGPMVLEVAQIPLYFVGGYGLARLALRAGSMAIRAGSVTGRVAASGTRLAAQAGLVGLEAADWAMVGQDVQQSCFPNELSIGSATADCNPETEIYQAYQEASIAQCLTASILPIMPLAGASVAYFRSARYEEAIRRANAASPDVRAQPSAARNTPLAAQADIPEVVGEEIVVTGRRTPASETESSGLTIEVARENTPLTTPSITSPAVRARNADEVEVISAASRTNNIPGLEGIDLGAVIRQSAPENIPGRVPFRNETLSEMEKVTAKWSPEVRQEINTFLRSFDGNPNKQRQYLALLLNDSSGNPASVLARLRQVESGQADAVIQELDGELSRIAQEMNGLPINDPRALELSARRSDLALQRVIIGEGDNFEVTGIFSANAYNNNFNGEGHSLADSFSLDIRVKPGSRLSVCRGSYGTSRALSNIVSGFYTFCRDSGYLVRGETTDVLAAPFDTGIPEVQQGYSRFNRFGLQEGTEMTLGRNGPVEYSRGAISGSGGNGGSVEFFDTRTGQRPKLDDLQGSVRPPICNRRINRDCDTIYQLQEDVRADRLFAQGNNSPAYLKEREVALDGIIERLSSQASDEINRLSQQGIRGRAAMDRLAQSHPELTSALNLRREIALKSGINSQSPLDTDTREFIRYNQLANSGQSRISDIVTASRGNTQVLQQRMREYIRLHPLAQEFRGKQRQLDVLFTQLRGNPTPAQRTSILSRMATIRGQQEDLTVAIQALSGNARYGVPEAVRGDIQGAIVEEISAIFN